MNMDIDGDGDARRDGANANANEEEDNDERRAGDERLKSSLWFSIGQIVDEETIKMGVNASPQFIGALTEMVWAQIENASIDMEAFARHANRSTVSTEDVLMLARRNEGLERVLKGYLEQVRKDEKAKNAKGKGKGKNKDGKDAGKGKDKGAGKGKGRKM